MIDFICKRSRLVCKRSRHCRAPPRSQGFQPVTMRLHLSTRTGKVLRFACSCPRLLPSGTDLSNSSTVRRTDLSPVGELVVPCVKQPFVLRSRPQLQRSSVHGLSKVHSSSPMPALSVKAYPNCLFSRRTLCKCKAQKSVFEEEDIMIER